MSEAVPLRRAVERGIITEAQALAIERLGREGALPEGASDDERLRLVTGFADIFVTIGLVLFLGTSAYLGVSLAGPAGGYGLAALLAWGLAEVFTRRRRMALPSIALLLGFALSSFLAVGLSLPGGAAQGGRLRRIAEVEPPLLAAAALATLVLVVLHYRRFRVPVTIAAGAAALAGSVVALAFAAAPDLARRGLDILLVVLGLATFALAMRFDLGDPARITRRTDVAFWLHLLAAPLIVHPILSALSRSEGSIPGSAGPVLAAVLLLTLVAVLIDRRAVLVSGLAYAGIAFGALIARTGLGDLSVPLSLLALGAFILVLSAGWHALRGALLRVLPPRVAARLPHPTGSR